MLNLIVTEPRGGKKEICTVLRKNSSEEISVHCARDADQALRLFCENPFRYDAVFLPADPPSERQGELFREVSQIRGLNPCVQIVLVFSYNYLPSSAADAGNVWLLRSPAESEPVNRLLRGLLSASEACRKAGSIPLSLRSGKDNIFITSDSVLYARKCRNGTRVVTASEDGIHRLKLDEFQRAVPRTFCRCHSSFLVNFRHAVRWSCDFILLDDGERIPVSRAFRKNVRNFISQLPRASDADQENG